tara:strand:- start:341 stop:844 length:504 start_codon:yes stop_codon:yes gene_type:complete
MNWLIKNCNKCEHKFAHLPNEKWKTVCPICYKAERGYSLTTSDHSLKKLQQIVTDQTKKMEENEKRKGNQEQMREFSIRLSKLEKMNTRLQVALHLKSREIKDLTLIRIDLERQLASRIRRRVVSSASIPRGMWKTLAFLCHPDRNPTNPDKAQDALTWLTDQQPHK